MHDKTDFPFMITVQAPHSPRLHPTFVPVSPKVSLKVCASVCQGCTWKPTISSTDLFQTEAFLCLDCRNLEIQVAETSTMYGKQKKLIDTIQASNNWVKA